jgi:hypothetical protein
MSPPRPQAGAPAAIFSPIAPGAAALARRQRGQSSAIVTTAVLLTAAMFANSALTIAGADRETMLFLEYAVWTASAVWMLSRLPPIPHIRRIGSPMRKGMIAFLIGLAVSTMFVWKMDLRSDIGRLLPQVAALAFMTLPFFVLNAAAKATEMEKAVLVTCHVILAAGLISILSDVMGFTDFEHGGGRYFGFLGDPVAWALTLPFVVYFSRGQLVLAAAAGLGIALTGSRAPAICVAAALLKLITLSRGRRIQYFVTLFLLFVLILYQSDIFETLANRFEATNLGSNDRLGTARLGWRIFEKSPYFGTGYNSLGHLFPYRFTSTLQNTLSAQTSTFVQMLSDGGIMQFSGYLFFVAATTVTGIGLMRRWRTEPGSGAINGIVAWVLSMLWVNQSAAWFVVGSYVGPIVLGMAGIMAGYRSRQLMMRAQAWARMPPG